MLNYILKKIRTIEDERTRKTVLIYTFSFIGILTPALFVVKGIKEHRELLYIISLAGLSFISTVNYFYFLSKKNIELSAHVLIVAMFTLCLLLFALIGLNNTGVLWYYIFSPLAILASDLKKGFFYNLGILIFTIILLINPLHFEINTYPKDFIVRFFATFIIFNLMLMMFEYTRNKAHLAYMKTLEDVKEKNDELQAAEEELKQQNEELVVISENLAEEKKEVELKNKEIFGSISYASRIQRALLPSEELKKQVIPESFVIMKQRDIIGGDFYFIKIVDSKIVIAVADCTGHGVPGAMMSMLGIALLEEVIDNVKILKSCYILDNLRDRLKKSFSDKDESSIQTDGMDIAVCVFDTHSKILSFAGANNPLYLIRKNTEGLNELIEYKADPMPIGVFKKQKPFTENEFSLQKDDLIYLFSDGYMSQFGHEKRKPLGSRRFKELLLENSEFDTITQQKNLEDFLSQWQGKTAQVDDILVAGVKVTMEVKI